MPREPDGVLGRIVADKLERVASSRARRSFDDLLAAVSPSDRSLADALSAPGVRFVLECKRASPSRGVLRPADSAADLARAYGSAGDAISVLVDEPFFMGSYDDLRDVSELVEVPVLCKDVVVDPYQVVEARHHGGDAVLVMLSVLDDAEARSCLELAESLAMDVVVEVHDEPELDRALALGARIIGINNRNLRSLEVDLAVTRRLAPRVPADRLVLAESGVRDRADVDRLASLADAFLVGTSLVSQPDVFDAARALVFGRTKVCGLTRPEDLRAAHRAGAAFGGLVFAEGSPRCIGQDAATRLCAAANGGAGGGLPLVGVFRNQPVDFIVSTARRLELAGVQLHGSESPEQVAAVRTSLPEGVFIWKAYGIADASDARAAVLPPGADRLLFDARGQAGNDTGDGTGNDTGDGTGTTGGGTGQRFDWSHVAAHPELPRALLAGGLDAHNAVAARNMGAWALDLSSGLESAPGVKDSVAIARLFDTLRGPCRGESATAPPDNTADPSNPSTESEEARR